MCFLTSRKTAVVTIGGTVSIPNFFKGDSGVGLTSLPLKLLKYFTKMKNQIISNFSKIDNDYLLKIVNIKNPLKNNKDLFQLYKIQEDINHINNKEFSYGDDIDYLRELLMFEDLTGNPSKLDNKKYLDRLLLN